MGGGPVQRDPVTFCSTLSSLPHAHQQVRWHTREKKKKCYVTFHTCECTSGEPGVSQRRCCERHLQFIDYWKKIFFFICIYIVLMSLQGELARCLKQLLNPFSCSIKPLRPDCKSSCRLNNSQSVWMTESAHGFSHLFCFYSVIPVSPTGSPTPSLPLAENYVILVQMHKQLKAQFSPVRWGLLSGKCLLPGSLRLCSQVSSITFKLEMTCVIHPFSPLMRSVCHILLAEGLSMHTVCQ